MKEPLLEKMDYSSDHIDFLFELLKLREFNISHLQDVSYEEHKNFVINHPYRAWFLVQSNGQYIGTIYIQNDNSIGTNFIDIKNNETAILKALEHTLLNHKPLPKINSVRSENFIMNLSPNNKDMIGIIEKLNFSLLQYTYVFKYL